MEIKSLKEFFFVGSDEEVEAFASTLKPRCLKATDKVIEHDGLKQRVIFNSEDNTYISPEMERYQVCEHCGKLEKVESFKTLNLTNESWFKKPGSRLFTKSVKVCASCANEQYVEDTFYSAGWYLPKEDAVVVYDEDGNKAYAHKRNPKLNGVGVVRLSSIDDNGEFVATNEFAKCGCSAVSTVKYLHNGHEVRVYILTSSIEGSPFLRRCASCGDLWLGEYLDAEGNCPSCTDMEIFGYHTWHDRVFKHAEGEEVSEKTLYFGTEVETEGDTNNRRLVAPIKDIMHLERDGSLGAGSFEIISQPMTWEYLVTNKVRIEGVFNALQEHGQKSHETRTCGFHVHVSAKALDGERAFERLLAIVHGLRNPMKKFARRDSACWARFDESFPKEGFDKNRIDRIDTFGHSVAINMSNRGSYDKDTVEFRIFKGTLNIVTYMATIQFVKNIVAAANSNDVIVRFNDLLKGEYIEQYIQQQAPYRDLHSDEYVNFAKFILGSKIGEFAESHSREDFCDIVRALSEVGGFGEVEVVFPEEIQEGSQLMSEEDAEQALAESMAEAPVSDEDAPEIEEDVEEGGDE